MAPTPGPSRSSASPILPPSPTPSTSNLDHDLLSNLNPISQEVQTASAEKRISFYVQAAEEMLEAVLGPLDGELGDESLQGREAHLFNEEEFAALEKWRRSDYQTKYLFIRLYLRKSRWIRLDSLDGRKGYEIGRDIEDLRGAAEDLWKVVPPLPAKSTSKDQGKGKERMKEEDIEMLVINSSPPAELKPLLDPKTPSPSLPSPPPIAKPKPDVDLTLDSDSDDDCLVIEPPSTPPPQIRKDTGYDRLAFSAKELEDEDPEMILGLLTMEELTSLAKKMNCCKTGPKTRSALTTSLLKTTSQTTLSFFTPPPPKKQKEGTKANSTRRTSFGMSYDSKGKKVTQSGIVKSEALKLIGDIILLHPSYRTLFDRLSLIYHRTPYLPSKVGRPNSASSFTMSLLARFGKRTYPTYVVKRSFEIFKSREELVQYEIALELNRDVEECLECVFMTPELGDESQSPSKGKGKERSLEEKNMVRKLNWKKGIEIFESVVDRWSEYCVKEELKDEKDLKKDTMKEQALLYYRMRFHPGWPLTRLMYKAAAIYGRLHDVKKELKIHRDLLAQKTFKRGKRGAWYDRLALLLMTYPSEEEANAKDKKKEKLKVKRLEEAKQVCEDGLGDVFTHLIYHSSLQRRISRIESALKVPQENRTTFDNVLTKARERVMEGERLDEAIVGRKSVWRANDGAEISVEELALEQYVKEGWKGFHSENGVLTSIFALIFWDIIFAPVDGVFETAFQSAPLDLATDAFSIIRRPLIDARLKAIKKGKAPKFLSETDDHERPLNTFCVGINWEKYTKEDLLEIVQCIGGPPLAQILRMFVEEYGHRTGGIPDLCLWNADRQMCMFSEVKGPGDHLSETQRVWLDVLLAAGVEVEVCKVWTTEERDEAESKKATKAKGKGRKRQRAKEEESDDEGD